MGRDAAHVQSSLYALSHLCRLPLFLLSMVEISSSDLPSQNLECKCLEVAPFDRFFAGGHFAPAS